MTTQELQAAADAFVARYGYEIEVKIVEGAIRRCKLQHTFAPWQPEVYAVEDFPSMKVTDLEVQTSSYGALGLQDLRCMITCLGERHGHGHRVERAFRLWQMTPLGSRAAWAPSPGRPFCDKTDAFN
jgi:hypothetical protein